MSATGMARALAWHRRAASEILAAFAAVPEARWPEPLAAGKWTVGELAEHLALSYDVALDALAGGPGMRRVLPAWKTQFLRFTVLRRILGGRGFPEGAPAPRELRPKAARSRGEGLARLRSRIDEVERGVLDADSTLRMSHAYFGLLTLEQILGVQAAHLEHHRRQLERACPS